jgi:hypothetical protein
MSITTRDIKAKRVYVTAKDPATKKTASRTFYNVTPEQFMQAAVGKLCEPTRTRRKQPAA